MLQLFHRTHQLRALWVGSNVSIATMRHTSSGWARITITPWTTPTNRQSWVDFNDAGIRTRWGYFRAFTGKKTNTSYSRKALAEKWLSSKYAIHSASSPYNSTWYLFLEDDCRRFPLPGIRMSSAGSISTPTRHFRRTIGCTGPATVRIGTACAPECHSTNLQKNYGRGNENVQHHMVGIGCQLRGVPTAPVPNIWHGPKSIRWLVP